MADFYGTEWTGRFFTNPMNPPDQVVTRHEVFNFTGTVAATDAVALVVIPAGYRVYAGYVMVETLFSSTTTGTNVADLSHYNMNSDGTLNGAVDQDAFYTDISLESPASASFFSGSTTGNHGMNTMTVDSCVVFKVTSLDGTPQEGTIWGVVDMVRDVMVDL